MDEHAAPGAMAGMGLPPGQRWIRRFTRYSALSPPKVDIDSYRLRVADVELSYGELLDMIDFRGEGWTSTASPGEASPA